MSKRKRKADRLIVAEDDAESIAKRRAPTRIPTAPMTDVKSTTKRTRDARDAPSSTTEGTSSSTSSSAPTSILGRCPNVSDRYEKIGRVGEGTYGVVYKARDKQTNRIVALKRCLPHHEASEGFPITTLREITILKQHRHPNIVTLYDVAVSYQRSGVFLVFEYCPHGDLAHIIDDYYQTHKRSAFDQPQVKRLMIQLLGALSFLHSRNILHRDLKLSNLLYDGQQLKVADLGLARTFSSSSSTGDMTPKVVSLWYRPPELLFGATVRYGAAIDVWGAGCILGELLLGVPLWQPKSEVEHIRYLCDHLGTPNPWPPVMKRQMERIGVLDDNNIRSTSCSRCTLWDRFPSSATSAVVLLEKMLIWDPSRRWSAKQALESKYLTKDKPFPSSLKEMPKFVDRKR